MRNRSIYINTSLPEDVKLQTMKTDYIVNEKKGTVVAILTWRVRYSRNSRLCDIAWSRNRRKKTKTGWVNTLDALVQGFQTTKGLAKVGPNDKFDVKRGKRIALARAETQAYQELVRELNLAQREISFIFDEIEVFKDRAENVRAGNRRFIQKVDAGEFDK